MFRSCKLFGKLHFQAVCVYKSLALLITTDLHVPEHEHTILDIYIYLGLNGLSLLLPLSCLKLGNIEGKQTIFG